MPPPPLPSPPCGPGRRRDRWWAHLQWQQPASSKPGISMLESQRISQPQPGISMLQSQRIPQPQPPTKRQINVKENNPPKPRDEYTSRSRPTHVKTSSRPTHVKTRACTDIRPTFHRRSLRIHSHAHTGKRIYHSTHACTSAHPPPRDKRTEEDEGRVGQHLYANVGALALAATALGHKRR